MHYEYDARLDVT